VRHINAMLIGWLVDVSETICNDGGRGPTVRFSDHKKDHQRLQEAQQNLKILSFRKTQRNKLGKETSFQAPCFRAWIFFVDICIF
jgi:hypothetical protein